MDRNWLITTVVWWVSIISLIVLLHTTVYALTLEQIEFCSKVANGGAKMVYIDCLQTLNGAQQVKDVHDIDNG